jgi:hypothetical protein
MFVSQLRRSNPRLQGDTGEAIAAGWLVRSGYGVWLPFGHSPDIDLIAQRGESLIRVQVKTSTVFRNGRWEVTLCTRGGNQSWSGVSKRLDQSRYDFLFVVVADWRCWFIPSGEIDAGSCILVGGPKYARFEMDPTGHQCPGSDCAQTDD